MTDLVGRFARDIDFDRGRVLITRHFPEVGIAHYIYVDNSGSGSQHVDHMEIEPHPTDECNRLRQEIEDLRDDYWSQHKVIEGQAPRAGDPQMHRALAEDKRKAAIRLTQILEGVQV